MCVESNFRKEQQICVFRVDFLQQITQYLIAFHICLKHGFLLQRAVLMYLSKIKVTDPFY